MPGILTTVTVTGEFDYVSGDDFSDASVTFELDRADYDTADEIVLSTAPMVVDLDSDGAFTDGIWPNSRGSTGSRYEVTLTYLYAGKYSEVSLGLISVPENGAPHDLSALLAAGAPALGTVLMGVITQAQYDDAIQAVAAAEAAETGAETAASVAETYAGVDHRAATWAALSAIVGTTGDIGMVGPDDTGTHTDPVASSTVPNEGLYQWSDDGAGSSYAERIGTTTLGAALDGKADEDEYPTAEILWGIKDSGDHVALGVRLDGKTLLIRDNEEVYDTGDGAQRWVWAIKDSEGYVALGVRADGTAYINVPSVEAGNALVPSDILGMDEFEVSGATIYNTTLKRFLSNADGDTTAYLQRRDIVSTTSVMERAKLRVILSYGQSLGIGGTDSPVDAVYSDTAPYPRTGLMFNSGIRGTGTTSEWDDSAATDLVGAYEQATASLSETPGTGVLAHLAAVDLAAARPRQPRFYFAAGAGGQDIDALAVNSQPWMNLIAALDKVIEIAAIYEMEVEVEAFIWTHGESNALTDAAVYQTKLEAIISEFRDQCDTRGVSPSAGAVPVVMDQLSSPSGNSTGRTPNIAFAAIAAADSRAWVSTAKYMLENTDGIHLKPADYRIMGEHIGRAIAEVSNTGDWQACRITGATLLGDTIEVDVYVPSGNLVRDTSQVPAVANDGFIYEDDTSSAMITGVTIGATAANACTITLQLSAIPSGANPKIMYAFDAASAQAEPNFGSVGNIRDNDPTQSAVSPADAGNGYLHNWLLIQPPLDL